MYNIPKTTFIVRMKGRVVKAEKYNDRYKLTLSEEHMLIQYILDLDAQGFLLQIVEMNDIADLLFTTYYRKPAGKHWVQRFI